MRIEPYSPPTPPVEPARNRLYQPPAAPRIAPYSPPAYVQPAAQHSAPVPLTLTAVSEPMPAVTASMSTTLEPRPVQIEQEPCTGELTQLHAPGLPAGGCPEDEYIDTVYPHPAEPVASWSITETGLDTIRNSLRRGRQWLISTSERLLAIAS